MSVFRLLIVGVLGLGGLLATRSAHAWHGFPPYGAWAYGSVPAYGSHFVGGFRPVVARTRTVYRSSPIGWGAYGNLGFASTTRVRWGGIRRPYATYRARYTSYYPTCFAPAYWVPRYTYVAPVVVYPQSYFTVPIVPTIVSPICATGSSNIPVTGGRNSISPTPVNASPTSVVAANLVSTSAVDIDDAHRDAVPAELLSAADAILRAGGYREAAKAYAQLSVRFGVSDRLYVRRFVAQIASGDLAQAEVVFALAEATGAQLSKELLPGGSLSECLDSSGLVFRSTESLAARAYQNQEDSLSLKAVATWLELSGDGERSRMFMQRAAQLDDQKRQEQPGAIEKIAPVDFELVAFE